MTKNWWKEGIVYQIYPRSFNDTSGNGVGALRGIIAKLDYIQSIGVDIIWLNPVYKSPNDDNGYDISDYQNIMSEFGTMQDFDELLEGMHSRGLKLIMDLVVKDNSYRDFYHWWPAEKGAPPKRWSYFDVNSDAWKFDEQTDSYYLHYFSQKQPDLKWENPAVRNEIYKMMEFWFDKGVDGFRMDVIPFISKDTNFPELAKDAKPEDFVAFYANGPELHKYLKEMNEKVLSKYDVMTVGEAPGIAVENALDFVDEDRKELNMFFHFDLMTLDRDPDELFTMNKNGWKLSEFKKIHTEWDQAFSKKGWGSMFLSNHDFPRSVSRWGNDHPDHWRNSATLLQTFLLSMRGTPYFYYGDEIGMTNIRFETIEQYRDINTINKYRQLHNQGKDLTAFIENEKEAARDNARTPMQWDETDFAGFSNSEPWISVNKNYKQGVSVKSQEADKYSVLNYFRKMCSVRKSNQALVYGAYELIDESNEQVYAYTRSLDQDRFLILLNFSTENSVYTLPAEINYNAAKLIISNDRIKDDKTYKEFLLLPYQAIVYKLL